MTSVSDESTASDRCERLFAGFLEQYHDRKVDPEILFAAHPEHAPTLRRWWHRLAAAGEVDPVHSGERFGRFVLLEQVGAGAQGCVHLAIDTELDRRIALKTLPLHRAVHSAAVDRFRREAAMASRLQHPGICTVYEAGELEGIAYIAMQFVEGETLAARLASARDRDASLPLDQVLELAEAVALALHAAHEAGLVHRDVKPGNIMVAADGRPVVLDFGLASDTNDNSDLTRTGDVLGTPSYMSPEQVHGNCGTLDRRTDVYSLGVVLFECLTLRRPFDAPTQEQLQQRILMAAVPDPRQWRPQLSRETVLVLNTALAKDRTHRYATARDFAEDLRRLRQHETVLAKPIGPLLRAWRWSRRRPALAASIALFLLSTFSATTIILLLYLEAEAARSKFGQLADLELLRVAESDAGNLHPVTPELAPQLAAWIEERQPLAQRLQFHREALAELRLTATSHAVGNERDLARHPDLARVLELRRSRDDFEQKTESARNHVTRALSAVRAAAVERAIEPLEAALKRHRVYVLADQEAALRHRLLGELVEGLEQFVAADGTLAEMRDRLAWARSVRVATIDDHAEAWREAAEAVARDDRYGHRTLVPQLGLVPLGADPSSGLQEFAFARGGTLPTRDPASGRLDLDAGSAPVLVLVPPGRFRMGADRRIGEPGYEPWAGPDEGPSFPFEIDWYLIGKHELTRGQWQRLARDHHRDRDYWSTEDLGSDPALHPITDVDWYRCTEVLARHELVLPTEARWEYAARAGSTTPFWFGPDSLSLSGATNFRARDGTEDDGYLFSAPAYSMLANRFGLHHIAGNVAEWCQDNFARNAYKDHETRPGDGLLLVGKVNARSVRGGSFATLAGAGRSASRNGRPGNLGNGAIGLRIVREVRR